MTSHCDELIPLLLRAADEALAEVSATERARLEAHLALCPSCTEALAGQRAMRGALMALAAEPVTTRVGTRVMATLRATPQAGAFSWVDALDWRRWTWRLVPVAAALALAAVSVARTDASRGSVAVETAGTMPVSSALVTGEVAGESLLSLLLSAGPDEALPVAPATQGGRQ